ncbi:MAG: type II toxin-antitoxin system prevent-host-death family antitoxin [Jatrophihabitantaceae bacterium]
MERIGVRELRQHASVYLNRVKAGETVEVTERGQLVALLVPPTPARGARDKMIAQGRLIPALAPMRLPARTIATEPTSTILDELRAERP